MPALPGGPDLDQFLHGDCAAFAIAAARALAKAGHEQVGISVLIDENGEPNTTDGRCACHAYASTAEFDLDAGGIRTAGDMSEDFDIHWFDSDGPFTEAEFLDGFCQPDGLTVDPAMIDLADMMLRKNPEFVAAIVRGPAAA